MSEPQDSPAINLQAEMGMASCVLQGAESGAITDDMFANRALWTLVSEARTCPDPSDSATVVTRLKATGLLEMVGGAARVVEVQRFAPSPAQLPYYLRIAKAARLRRRMRAFAGEVMDRATDPAFEADELAETVEVEALALRDDVSEGCDDIPSMRDAMMRVMQTLGERVEAKRNGIMPGIASGLVDLDHAINGFQGGRVYVFGARPGMGKTSLVRQILLKAARSVPVYLLNLEMSVDETLEAMLSTEGLIDYGRMQGGDLTTGDFGKIHRTTERLLEMPIHVDDRMLTASRIEASVRRMVRTRKIGMFAIDYLQLVRASSKEEERSPLLKIGNASNALVRIAKEHKIPVIAIVQLNREAEEVPAAGLSRAYIRDCGQIEQDAAFIGLLGSHTNGESKPRKVNAMTGEEINDAGADDGPMEMALKVTKNRQGRPDGLIPLVFRGQYLKFETKSNRDDD